VRSPAEPDLRRTLGRGELVGLVYRLGRSAASGVLTLTPGAGRPEVFALRRGAAVCPGGDLARRGLVARLARCAAEPAIAAAFEGGVAAYPPGAPHQVALAAWARSHLEAQLDAALAERLVHQLGGRRLAVRTDLAPEPLDEADRRMLAALTEPRRLDQIWPVARAPRFRLLAFLHFLRAVGALEIEAATAAARGTAAGRADPDPPRFAEPAAAVRVRDARRIAALRLLGLDAAADADTVKRAYRRLARALHPDLQPDADGERRRVLERRFAEVTAAYDALS
jgi:DnaJ-domain-containing protein 1